MICYVMNGVAISRNAIFVTRRYLRWAAANERRAASAHGQDFKVLLRRIAAQYRDLAEQSDDPEAWRAKRRVAGTKPH